MQQSERRISQLESGRGLNLVEQLTLAFEVARIPAILYLSAGLVSSASLFHPPVVRNALLLGYALDMAGTLLHMHLPAKLQENQNLSWLRGPSCLLVLFRDPEMATNAEGMFKGKDSPSTALAIVGKRHLTGMVNILKMRGWDEKVSVRGPGAS